MRSSALWLPALLALSCGWAGVVHAQQAVTLEQHMGAAAFKQAGLDKLQPAELAYLQQWLDAHAAELSAAVPASSLRSAKAAVRKPPTPTAAMDGGSAAAADRVVSSAVAGRFQGWQHGSVLTLHNGQKWRVIDDSSLAPRKAVESPAVTVKPGAFGGWFLKVRGYNTSARVEPAN